MPETSKMSEHTKGPWFGFIAEGSFDIMAAGRMGCIASCPKGDGHDADANSRLIAAAPDLLAALQEVMKEWREGYGLRCERQVRSAIAKATGGRVRGER